MTRSSPMAAPTAALMATKWLTTTVSTSSASNRPTRESRQPRVPPPRSAQVPAIASRSQPRFGNGTSVGDGISPTPSRLSRIAAHRRSSGAAVSRLRRNGLTRIGSGPSGATSVGHGLGLRVPSSSSPGSGSSLPAGRGLAVAHQDEAGVSRARRTGRRRRMPGRRALADEPLGAERAGRTPHSGMARKKFESAIWLAWARMASRLWAMNAGHVDRVGDERLGQADVGVLVDLGRIDRRAPARARPPSRDAADGVAVHGRLEDVPACPASSAARWPTRWIWMWSGWP